MLFLNNILLIKPIALDPYMVQVIGWLLVFLFTSLIAIIVWLAKGVLAKLDAVSDKQDRNQNQVVSMKATLEAIQGDMTTIKRDNEDIFKRLNTVEKEVALSNQWIRLKGGT